MKVWKYVFLSKKWNKISELGNLWPGCCRSLKVVGLTGCVKYYLASNLHVFLQRCVSTPLRYCHAFTIVQAYTLSRWVNTIWTVYTIVCSLIQYKICLSQIIFYGQALALHVHCTLRPHSIQSFSGPIFLHEFLTFLSSVFLPSPHPRFLSML